MSEPRELNAGRAKWAHYYGDNVAILTELQSQSDRGAAIVGVAFLDDKLRKVTEFAFPEPLSRRKQRALFGPTAPLGTYDAKIRLASALGLLPDEVVGDLQLLGRIRNRFAHDLDIREFSHPVIAPLCEQLIGYRTESVARDGTTTRILEYRGPPDARRAFILSVDVAVHLILIFAEHRVGGGTAPSGTSDSRGA